MKKYLHYLIATVTQLLICTLTLGYTTVPEIDQGSRDSSRSSLTKKCRSFNDLSESRAMRKGSKGEVKLSGVVADVNNGPIERAIVALIENGRSVISLETDKSGRFVFDKIKMGKYVVQACGEGYMAHKRSIDLNVTNDQLLLVTLVCGFSKEMCVTAEEDLLTITGIVEDDKGQPVPFANVGVSQGGDVVTGGVTDFDGVYKIKKLLPGKYEVRTSSVGYYPETRSVTLKTESKILRKISLEYGIAMCICNWTAPRILSGMVTGSDGAEIPYANLALFRDGEMISGVVAGFDGAFKFESLEYSTFQLTVSAVGYQTLTVDVDRNKKSELSIVLEKGIELPEVICESYRSPIIVTDGGSACVGCHRSHEIRPGIILDTLVSSQSEQIKEETVEVQVFPNPVMSVLNVRTDQDRESGGLLFRIVAENGAVVQDVQRLRTSHSIDVSDLAKGAYFFEVIHPEGVMYAKPFIKL